MERGNLPNTIINKNMTEKTIIGKAEEQDEGY